jgi:hypothetical protein
MTDDDDRERAQALAIYAMHVGTWDAESVITPPGAPPIHQTGVSENRMIADGRWLLVHYNSNSGYEGHGVYGWDDEKRVYICTWVDPMMSRFAQGEGTWDAATRTLTFEMEVPGKQHFRYREIIQIQEDGSRSYRNLVLTPDGELEMIRILYRKRK